jgi:DNA-binding NarL/FixJ family response regulator
MTELAIAMRASVTEQPAVVVGLASIRSEIVNALYDEGLEVALAERADAVADLCRDGSPSLIVLLSDRSGPGASSALSSLRDAWPKAHLVFVCASIQGWEIRAALAAGADGIVLGAAASSTLGPCLRAVQAGQICVPRSHGRQINRPVLSLREKQILGLVAMGYTNSQIAERLYLAESTIKSHLSSVYCKLEVRSRYEAADLVLNPERGMALGTLALGSESRE